MAVLWIGFGAAGFLVGRYARLDEILCACAGALVGLFGYAYVCRRFTVWRFRTKLQDKGTPLHMNLRMELTPEALVYEVQDIYHRAKWSGVSELFPNRGYWIFIAQSSPFFAPKRFFASEAEERAFVREALGHMSERARARSEAAVKFAGTA